VRINKHYFDRYSLLVLSGRPVNTGIGNIWQVYHHGIYPLMPPQPGHLSMCTGNGFGHHWGRNGKFSVTVGTAIATLACSQLKVLAFNRVTSLQTKKIPTFPDKPAISSNKYTSVHPNSP